MSCAANCTSIAIARTLLGEVHPLGAALALDVKYPITTRRHARLGRRQLDHRDAVDESPGASFWRLPLTQPEAAFILRETSSQ